MIFYDAAGYLDFRAVRDLPVPFVVVVGGRGTGKTYGALRSCVEDKLQFALMRRKQVQLDIINKPQFSPIRPVCRDTGWKITTAPIARGLSGYYWYEEEDGRAKITGPPIGINIALATVANLRGYDASGLDILIYDEAIPEQGEQPIPGEWDKLANCYETLNRNRELEYRQPLKLVCLANANKQTAPILEGLHLVGKLDKMIQRGQSLYMDAKRGLALVLLKDSPISAAKSDTALYRLTAGTQYADMAINNAFAWDDKSRVKSMPLREMLPVLAVGEVTVYRHKSRREWYVSAHRSGAPELYGTTELELARLRRSTGWLWEATVDGNVWYESYEVQTQMLSYLNL